MAQAKALGQRCRDEACEELREGQHNWGPGVRGWLPPWGLLGVSSTAIELSVHLTDEDVEAQGAHAILPPSYPAGSSTAHALDSVFTLSLKYNCPFN